MKLTFAEPVESTPADEESLVVRLFTRTIQVSGLGLEEFPIKLIFRSVSRDNSSYQIMVGKESYDLHEARYAARGIQGFFEKLSGALQETLNLLWLDEETDAPQILPEDLDLLKVITAEALKLCEGRFGNGAENGEVVVTFS